MPYLVIFMITAQRQRTGIGRRAVRLLAQELREAGWTDLEVSFVPIKRGAEGFWRLCGFTGPARKLNVIALGYPRRRLDESGGDFGYDTRLLIAVGGSVLIALVTTWAGGLVSNFGAGVAWSGRAISKQSRGGSSAI